MTVGSQRLPSLNELDVNSRYGIRKIFQYFIFLKLLEERSHLMRSVLG